MSIELVMLSNHLILHCPLLLLPLSFPGSRSFLVSQLFPSGGQSIEASSSASVLRMSTQGWFPLGMIGLISLSDTSLSDIIYKYCLPSKWVIFSFCQWFSLLYKSFQVYLGALFIFLFFFSFLSTQIQKILLRLMSRIILLLFYFRSFMIFSFIILIHLGLLYMEW